MGMIVLEPERTKPELDPESESAVLTDWVRMDTRMRQRGQESVIPWSGGSSMPRPFDRVAVSSGSAGYVDKGTVVRYALVERPDGDVERGAWVELDSDSSLVKLRGRDCRLLSDEDMREVQLTKERFDERLSSAVKKVERQRKEKRRKAVRGSHLVEPMIAEVESRTALSVDPKSGFYKVTGRRKRCAVYVAKKGGRVDLSGFCVEHDAVKPVTAEEARAKHIGRVRGQVDFGKGDDQAMSALRAALDHIERDE